MKTFVLASNNKHKVREFKQVLSDYEILTLEEVGFLEEIEETGETFLENALIKARTIHNYLKEKGLDYMVVSDDSGLCCDALNGAPGIHTARYAGVHDDYVANRKKLLEDLEGKDRSASYVCTIVFIDSDGTEKHVVGQAEGSITTEELGRKDFAYDCVFYSNDLQKTYGEASEEEKNLVSHRGKAIEKLKAELENQKSLIKCL